MEQATFDIAGRSQGYCAELLERLAEANAVDETLDLFRRLASPSCLWLEGGLAVELFEEDEGVRVRVLEELGNGMRERVLPAVTFRATLSDVLAEIYDAPERLGDLRIERVSSRCALLVGGDTDDVVPSSLFEISETCLSVPPPPVATVDDLDRGWDDAS